MNKAEVETIKKTQTKRDLKKKNQESNRNFKGKPHQQHTRDG